MTNITPLSRAPAREREFAFLHAGPSTIASPTSSPLSLLSLAALPATPSCPLSRYSGGGLGRGPAYHHALRSNHPLKKPVPTEHHKRPKFLPRPAAGRYLTRTMHHIAPIPIILGVGGVIVALLWLFAAGSEEDGGPQTGLFYLFGALYIGLRVMKQLARDPMSVLPAFGILIAGAALIWVGVLML
jgi:hypothetical protein